VKLGDVLTATQYLLQADGQRDASLETGRKSVAHWERVAQSLPSDDDVRSGLAAAYFGLANSPFLGWSERMEFWKRAQAIYEALVREKPTDTNRMRNAALVHKYMSGMYNSHLQDAIVDLNRSFDHAQAAVELDERRVQAQPQDSQAKLDLAFSLSMVGSAWEHRNDFAKATEYFVRSLEIRRTLWQADPKNHQARESLANALARVGDAYWQQGDWKHAVPLFREAIEHGEALTRNDDLWASWETVAFSHLREGEIEESRASGEACTEWNLAARAMKHVIDRNPSGGSLLDYSADLPMVERKLAACGDHE
jgi:tetratricopeptide (TPR) repeat protein